MASIHETAEGLHNAGVMDKQTMRKFDDACLTPVRPLSAEEIRALREREGARSIRKAPRWSSSRLSLKMAWWWSPDFPLATSIAFSAPELGHILPWYRIFRWANLRRDETGVWR
jgi:hypothetical protein